MNEPPLSYDCAMITSIRYAEGFGPNS
jgi:hypothetical protein